MYHNNIIGSLNYACNCRLYDHFNDVDNAAAAYTEYCLSDPKQSAYSSDQSDLYGAYRYLANYHLKKGRLDDAYTYAYKCVEYEQVNNVIIIVH